MAYKGFGCFVSPPVLLGLGMFLASVTAATYYNEWDLNTMLLETFVILAFSPLLFTFVCLLLKLQNANNMDQSISCYMDFATKKINITLILLIITGGIYLVYTQRYYSSSFGDHLDFSETLFAARLNAEDVELPLYLKLIDLLNGMISYFTIWLLCIYIFYKKHKGFTFVLLALQLCITALIGLMSGSKGELLDPFIRFAVAYIMFCSIYNKVSISHNILKIILGIAIGIYVLGVINTFVGRSMDNYSSSVDLFAEYCGAEFKNFDTFIRYPNRYSDYGNFGEQTFSLLYNDLGYSKVKYAGKFESIGPFSLGNVYTQYMSFYKDFGYIGVVGMTIVIAVISMLLYNSMLLALRKCRLNVYVFLYMSAAYCLFMSFFSSRFTERFFRIGMIRNIIIFSIAIFLFNRYIIRSRK